MKKHYVRKYNLAITDDVFGRIQKVQPTGAEAGKAAQAIDGPAPTAGEAQSQGAARRSRRRRRERAGGDPAPYRRA